MQITPCLILNECLKSIFDARKYPCEHQPETQPQNDLIFFNLNMLVGEL